MVDQAYAQAVDRPDVEHAGGVVSVAAASRKGRARRVRLKTAWCVECGVVCVCM